MIIRTQINDNNNLIIIMMITIIIVIVIPILTHNSCETIRTMNNIIRMT